MREKGGVGKARHSWAMRCPVFGGRCLIGPREQEGWTAPGCRALGVGPAYWEESGLDIFRPISRCTLWSLFSLCEMGMVTAPKTPCELGAWS